MPGSWPKSCGRKSCKGAEKIYFFRPPVAQKDATFGAFRGIGEGDRLAEEHDWSDSVSNLSAKLQRESIRYKEVIELADVLGYDIVWQKRRER